MQIYPPTKWVSLTLLCREENQGRSSMIFPTSHKLMRIGTETSLGAPWTSLFSLELCPCGGVAETRSLFLHQSVCKRRTLQLHLYCPGLRPTLAGSPVPFSELGSLSELWHSKLAGLFQPVGFSSSSPTLLLLPKFA